MLYLGIDLGTTFSLAAYINAANQVALVPDRFDTNSFRTPSVVHIGSHGGYVGDAVEALLQEDPATPHVRFVKLAMGENQHFPDHQQRAWRPEAISALVLKKLLDDTRSFLPDDIGGAVVTVPANFSDKQRQATKQAALLAGIPRVTLIEEPIAAATFYGVNDISGDQTLFVFDLGGGTFDATLLQADDNGLFVLGTDGQHDLGGKTVDEAIMQQIADEYERLHDADPREDPTALVQMRQFATEAKLELCRPGVTQVRKTLLLNRRSVDFLLTLPQFNRLVDKLVDQALAVCERCLQGASMGWELVDHILLTGGSSLLPLVREKLAERTGRPKDGLLLKQPHQAVAYGAALIANQLFANDSQQKKLQRATAWQLGIRVAGRDGQPVVQVMIDKNQPVPASKTVTFHTNREGQPRMVIEVVQQKGPNDNEKSLGYFLFALPDNAPVRYAVEITLAYDMEGLVTATARNPQTGQQLKQVMDENGAALDDELVRQKEWIDHTPVNS
ncbi:Hsp70 family protein [Alcanivorax sp. S6407]|uniref:Hsp70 family protein n=1 Tax=Alcanivorax sp. S6407 TaxID=2926424 RepID=UPI001FF3B1AC|nr:Hsp70 family protein [Alcanivorax sp. S6407]MCK0154931.1 Hsp70 family protein [Alcanivorax sp. S6407]